MISQPRESISRRAKVFMLEQNWLCLVENQLRFVYVLLFQILAYYQYARFCKVFYNYPLKLLRYFELESGVRVNFFKTKMGRVGLETRLLKQFFNILNCKYMKISFMYLEMPIGGNSRRSQFWQPVINKVRNRLSSWKGKLIFVVGRVCLIKSVISALLLYYMSFFKMLKSVKKELIKIQRNFLWGWGSEARKIAWVSWENICKPNEMEGLGIRDIGNFNTTLLAKWKWTLGVEDHGVWKQILDSKYGSWRVLNEANTSRTTSKWWKDIQKVCGNTESGHWFDNCID